MHFPDLLPLADQGALYAYLRQLDLIEHLESELGAHTWELHEGTLSFRSVASDATVRLRTHPVATLTHTELRWAWADGIVDPVSLRLGGYGDQHGVASLSAATVPFRTSATGRRLALELTLTAHRVATAAVAVTGVGPYYCVPEDDGSARIVLVSGAVPPLRYTDHTTARIEHGLATAGVVDRERAIAGLERLAGFRVTTDAVVA